MKKLLVLAAVAVAALLLLRPAKDKPEDKLVFDRVWIDHLPRTDRDMVNVFAVLASEDVGIFQAASQWKRDLELFQTGDKGAGTIAVVYPQTREREVLTVRATACKRDGFDYCLEVAGGSRGVKEYGSKKEWVIDAHTDVARLQMPQL